MGLRKCRFSTLEISLFEANVFSTHFVTYTYYSIYDRWNLRMHLAWYYFFLISIFILWTLSFFLFLFYISFLGHIWKTGSVFCELWPWFLILDHLHLVLTTSALATARIIPMKETIKSLWLQEKRNTFFLHQLKNHISGLVCSCSKPRWISLYLFTIDLITRNYLIWV